MYTIYFRFNKWSIAQQKITLELTTLKERREFWDMLKNMNYWMESTRP